MRIDKLIASLQAAGLAIAASPGTGLYQRSFNDTGFGNDTTIQAASATASSSTVIDLTSSTSASITASENSTTSALSTSAASITTIKSDEATTTASIADQATFAASSNSTALTTSAVIADAIGASRSESNQTQQPDSSSAQTSSTLNGTLTATASAFLAVSTPSNTTTTAFETEEVTRTSFRNSNVTATSVVNGTLTTYITTQEPSQSGDLTITALIAPTTTASLVNLTSASGSSHGCSSYYIAQDGDSCETIAALFSSTVEDFKLYNPSVESCETLSIGVTYCVPPQSKLPSRLQGNATLVNATISGNASSSAANNHFALIDGSTVVVAEITSTIVGSVASSAAVPLNVTAGIFTANAANLSATAGIQFANATAKSLSASASSLATSDSVTILGSSVLTSPLMASAVQALSATTETVTSVITKTNYFTVDVTSTTYVTSTEYVVTVTELVTKYVTVSLRALFALGSPNTLITDSACGAAKTIIVTLPASLSPTIVATPGMSRSQESSTTPGVIIVSSGSTGSLASSTAASGSQATGTTGSGSTSANVQFCPDLNNTVWTDAQGTGHLIYCNKGFNGTVISVTRNVRVLLNTAAVSNTTLDNSTTLANTTGTTARKLRKRVTPSSLAECIAQCNSMSGCVGTAYESGTCTYYSDLTTSYTSTGVQFAKVVVNSNVASTTIAASSSSTIICNPSITAFIKSNRPKPRVFCTNWLATRPHTTSPFSNLLPKQVTNACNCILSFPPAGSASSTFTTSTKSSTCSAVSPPGPTQTGIVSGCSSYYVAKSGDYCYLIADKYNLDVNTFMTWNPAVNAPSCNNLQVGAAYCVAIGGGCGSTGTSTTLTSSAGTTKTTSTSTSTSPAQTTAATGAVSYKMYTGNGTVAAGWPMRASWLDFDTLFTLNLPIMKSSCLNNWAVPNDSDDEIANLKSAILSIGAAQQLDPRFILAIVMQESNGCVRVITTSYGVTNPGLMQSHNGAGSCNRGGVVQTPCPASQITQMITDGTAGTADGDGLVGCIASTGIAVGDVSRYYRAARIYNGGVGGYNKDDLGSGCCTLCYASDVANRLTGWSSGPSGCKL